MDLWFKPLLVFLFLTAKAFVTKTGNKWKKGRQEEIN